MIRYSPELRTSIIGTYRLARLRAVGDRFFNLVSQASRRGCDGQYI